MPPTCIAAVHLVHTVVADALGSNLEVLLAWVSVVLLRLLPSCFVRQAGALGLGRIGRYDNRRPCLV